VFGDGIACDSNLAADTTSCAIGSCSCREHGSEINSDATIIHATKPSGNGDKHLRSFLQSVIAVAKVRRIFPLLRFVTNLSAKRRQQYATESGGGVLTTPTSQPANFTRIGGG
jgi:hypothetical protein